MYINSSNTGDNKTNRVKTMENYSYDKKYIANNFSLFQLHSLFQIVYSPLYIVSHWVKFSFVVCYASKFSARSNLILNAHQKFHFHEQMQTPAFSVCITNLMA